MRRYCLPLIIFALPLPTNAAPSIGQLLNESQTQFPTIYLPSVGQLSASKTNWQLPEDQGPGLRVEQFHFTGNRAVPDAVLQQAFAAYVGRDFTPRQIYSMTDLVKQTYRQLDIAATAEVPPQDVIDGVVTIQVREARFVGAELDYGFEDHFNVDLDRIQAVAEHNVSSNPPLRISEMERGQLLAIDLHGVAVSGGHHPNDEGDQQLELWVENTPVYSGTLDFNNSGNSDTGTQQLVLTSLYSSPFGRGGATYINAIKSEGLNFASLAYRGPIGYGGATFDLQLGLLDAETAVGSDNAQSYSIGYRYPILRTVPHNLFITALAERRDLDSQIDTFDLTLDGNRAFNGARLTYSAQVTLGTNDQPGADQQFGILSGFVDYSRFYDSGWRYSARLGGQFASGNLNTADQLIVSGTDRLRGYGSGEILADQGAIARLDLSKRLGEKLTLGSFIDYAAVRPIKSLTNQTNLGNVGLLGRVRFSPELALSLSVAEALKDSSGTTRRGDRQVYMNLSLSF